MSQAKIDKRKYEKIHRKEIEKKRKMKFAVKCIATALVVGAIFGIPAGISIYRNMPKFVGDATLESYVGTYIQDNYAEEISSLYSGDKEDATESTTEATTEIEDVIEDAIEDAVEE
ncbi:MAG: hypothetical protein IJP29_07425 [Lachnospiraceae bacterium]|nr:hypothetical protein [Lachnospiraceae bacterium]